MMRWSFKTGSTVKPVETIPIAIQIWSLRQVVSGDSFNCTEMWDLPQEYVVLQDRWSLMAVVYQERFHCTVVGHKGCVGGGGRLHTPHTCLNGKREWRLHTRRNV